MAASLPTAPAARTYQKRPTAPPADGNGLSLDARLAATDAAMTVRLEEVALAYEVDTARPATVVDLADIVTVPLTPAPQTPPQTYATPVAALLERARARMEADGWCAGALIDDSGAVCLLGAIRKEADGDRGLEADAAAVVLDAIRHRFSDIDSVPAFNDAYGTGRVPVRVLGEAALRADAHGL